MTSIQTQANPGPFVSAPRPPRGLNGLTQLLKGVAKQQAEDRRDGVISQSLRHSEANRNTESAAMTEQVARKFEINMIKVKAYVELAKAAQKVASTVSGSGGGDMTMGDEVSSQDAQSFIDRSSAVTTAEELGEIDLPKGLEVADNEKTVGDLFTQDELEEALRSGYTGEDIAKATLSMPVPKDEVSKFVQDTVDKLVEFGLSSGDSIAESKNKAAQILSETAEGSKGQGAKPTQTKEESAELQELRALRNAILGQTAKV